MGYTIQYGATGISVSKMQSYFNVIRTEHPSIPKLTVDAKFGDNTKAAVERFQAIMNLAIDGIIGTNTWSAIVMEFNQIGIPLVDEPTETPLQDGSQGLAVQKFQSYLNHVLKLEPELATDGIFGTNTKQAVMKFQAMYDLKIDGLLGNKTWNKIIDKI